MLLLFVLLWPVVLLNADPCSDCIAKNQTWCSAASKCSNDGGCDGAIKRSLNCPRLPDASYAYDDHFARTVVNPLIAAVYNNDPSKCFKKQLPSYVFYSMTRVNCSVEGPGTTCHGFTAYDPVSKTVIASFAGTDGAVQMTDEILSFLQKRVPFYQYGHIFKYFHDAFFHLWNGGMEHDIRQLKYIYPDYSLLVVGHSLGASIATTMASYTVQYGLWQPAQIKLMTIGQPRTGDYQFATWHDATFPYAYRVVHHRDPVPHIPPSVGPDPVFHHRYEVWYNNNMTVGDPYTICPEADGLYCSNREINENNLDHLIYFNINVPDWGGQGCP